MPRLQLAATSASESFELDAILFDVGGTLLRLDHGFLAECATRDGSPLEVDAVARGEAQARIEVDRRAANVGGVRERDADRIVGYFATVFRAAGVADVRASALAESVARTHAKENLWRIPLPGAAETLAALVERGFAIGAVSNADGRVASLLATAGLLPHLAIVLDSHLEGVEKPHPEIFRRALDRFGVEPARAAYVGDIYAIDAVGARGAGLHPILIDETGSYPARDCPRIARLDELIGGGTDAIR